MAKEEDADPVKLTPKKRVLDAEQVAEKLRELNGNQAAVARFFGVTRQSVNDYVRSRPELRAACHDARESMKDHAESSLYRAVLAGEAWATCFYLKTQGKDRGYVEKGPYQNSGPQYQRIDPDLAKKIAREAAEEVRRNEPDVSKIVILPPTE